MNVGVLLLGRGLGRRGEVAVRHALGAGRGRLVRQFLAESLVLSACGGVLGIGSRHRRLRGCSLPGIRSARCPPNGVQLDMRALAAATLAMAITTIVAGLVPAIRLSASGPWSALRSSERGRATAPAQRAQRVMLVAQMAVSTVLLVCAALLAERSSSCVPSHSASSRKTSWSRRWRCRRCHSTRARRAMRSTANSKSGSWRAPAYAPWLPARSPPARGRPSRVRQPHGRRFDDGAAHERAGA